MHADTPWTLVFHGMVNPAYPWRVQNAHGDTVAYFMDGAEARRAVAEHNEFAAMRSSCEKLLDIVRANGFLGLRHQAECAEAVAVLAAVDDAAKE